MERLRLVWLVARTALLGAGTYLTFSMSVVTAEACVQCALVGGVPSCVQVASGYTTCVVQGSGCLTTGNCGC